MYRLEAYKYAIKIFHIETDNIETINILTELYLKQHCVINIYEI